MLLVGWMYRNEEDDGKKKKKKTYKFIEKDGDKEMVKRHVDWD